MENSTDELLYAAESASDPLLQICDDQRGANESVSLVQQSRMPNLPSLQIPARSPETAASSFSFGLPPRSNSTNLQSTVKNLLPQMSFRRKNVSNEFEKTVQMTPVTATSDGFDKSSSSRLSSLKSAHSFPGTPNASSYPETAQQQDNETLGSSLSNIESMHSIQRSSSAPNSIRDRSARRTDGVLFRVFLTTQRPPSGAQTQNETSVDEIVNDVSSEDISEEAICRICFVELSEGGETLKMECSCRGELAYAHRECAITWFRTKGDNKCEVCQEEVRNLPVTLLTVHNPRNVPEVNNNVAEVNNNAAEANKCRQVEWDQHYLAAFDEFAGYLTPWLNMALLSMVSVPIYFYFLKLLLTSKLGSRVIAVSLWHSLILGILSSLVTIVVVRRRRYMLAYTFFQFALVILFSQAFYTPRENKVTLSIFLSSVFGFGLAISSTCLLKKCWQC